MVEVDGVGLEDVGSAGCSWVNVLVGLPGVEWCVVVFADGKGDGVSGWWLEANAPAHQALGEGLLGVVAKTKASTTCAASKGPCAAPPPTRRGGVGVASAIVGGGHIVGYVCWVSGVFEYVCSSSARKIQIMVVYCATGV